MQLPYRKPTKFSVMQLDPIMSQEKFDELSRKLTKLKADRPKAATEVSRLAELGDFSENVEYQLAKGRLRKINENILIIETHLNQADIIKKNTTGRVAVGSTVTVEVDGQEKTYEILGSSETNPAKGVISHTSPIGAALIGHTVDDVVEIDIAKNKKRFTIKDIT
jgi:transcription elongation factor GreA